jgi:hypothetical protein
MKKIFLSITALFSFIVIVNAQNTSPYWSLAGNSNATSSSKLGTTNAINLRLFTNNLERMRITTSGLVGIGTTSPIDKLHVNSPSGTNALRAQVNGATKLLVHGGGGVAIGANSTPPSNGLYVSGNVGIGTNTPLYKFQVQGNASIANGLYVSDGITSSNNSGDYGIYSYGNYAGVYGYSANYGVYGSGGSYGVYATGYSGVYGIASGSTGGVLGAGKWGVYGMGTTGGSYGNGSEYGAMGVSSSGYGVRGESSSGSAGYFSSTSSHGIWAKTSSTASGVYAGVFQGNVYTYNAYQTSDKNLKKNIKDVGEAMNIIKKLKPKNYDFRDDGKYATLHLPKGNHYGLLAQDLEQVLPNLVHEAPLQANTGNKKTVKTIKLSADGKTPIESEEQQEITETINTKAVNYTELIPIVIKGMQELSNENEDLKKQIEELKLLVKSITKPGANMPLSSSALLKQSVPNPSNDNTRISYYTPDDSRNAQILVSDMKGRVLKAFTVSKGEGQVYIRRGELPSGIYNYTLYINSSKIDTKQMIITR